MWTEPKTNWHCETVNGEYQGDYFNAKDYNRIKNNSEKIRSMAYQIYGQYEYIDTGLDKQSGENFYADEFNMILKQLKSVGKVANLDYLERLYLKYQVHPNHATMNYQALNDIENCILKAYETFSKYFEYSRKFTWNFEDKGEV